MNPIPPLQSPARGPRRRAGVALVIILALVVILTGVIIAFFSRAITNRSVSNASANETKVDLVAEGAADSIVGYLQQEIVLSSSATLTSAAGTAGIPSTSGTIYLPLTPASMLPQMSGTVASGITSWAPNFLVRSASNQNFYTGASSIPSNAINVSSTTSSLNGRSVSLARWNAHYLLPLASSTDATPITTGTAAFAPPDWVLVARNGSNPTTWNSNMTTSATNGTSVIGRYAYAIYHEGGLLDANVAGYPVGNPSAPATGTNQYAYKPALAYADLTQIGLTQTQVDELVAWRNYASTQTTGTSFQSPNFTQTSGSNYYSYVMSNPTGFLSVSSTGLNNNGVMSLTTGQSDRMFGSRQELIAFMEKGLGLSGTSLNVLNYLATFTRGIDQPSFAPDPTRPLTTGTANNWSGNNAYGLDNQINPAFLTVRISGTFTRYDGHPAAIGDPLVNKRFPLQKLAWLTYLGPSANRASNADVANATSPGVSSADYDLWQLVHLYGIPVSYLQLGTAANIQNYFGLTWQVDVPPTAKQLASGPPYFNTFHDNEYKWFYNCHNYTGSSVSGSAGPISRLTQIAASSTPREPDFFELLKAAVAVGSKAKGAINITGAAISASKLLSLHPYYIQTLRDTSLDYAIIQLGANIIDQAKCDGYSTRIVFNDGGGTVHEFRGVENLPYLYRIQSATLKLRLENPVLAADVADEPPNLKDPGIGLLMEIPTIWNPHDENAPLGDPAPAGPGAGTPTLNFRLVADSVEPDDIETSTTNISAWYTTFAANGSDSGNTGAEHGAVASNNDTTTQANASLYTTGTGGTGQAITPVIQLTGTGAQPLSPNNSVLTFVVPNSTLFREPTVLAMPNVPSGSNLQMGPPITEFTLIRNSAGNPSYSSAGGYGYFISDSPNPLSSPAITSTNATSQGYIGICAGLYPVEWVGPPEFSGTMGIHRSDNVTLDTYNGGGAYLTYRLQYKDPNPADTAGTGWVTYDEKYTQFDCLFLGTAFGNAQGNLSDQAEVALGGDWQSYADPRTSRFCAVNGLNFDDPPQTPGGAGESQEWADATNNVEVSDRPDTNSGYCISDMWANTNQEGENFPNFSQVAAAGWTMGANHFRIGLLSQNSMTANDNGVRFAGDNKKYATSGEGAMYYSDPDGVVRGATGVYATGTSSAPAATTVGLPLATAYPSGSSYGTTGQSRPYILHRPFRSVAELGYVFSGTPWKNIDFFTTQSGDAPLLDVFTVNEPPTVTSGANELVAGTVDLNTQQEPVLQAVLAGAYAGEAAADVGTTHPFTAVEASAILTNTSSLITRTASTAMGQGPLQNVSELVGRWVAALAAASGTNAAYSGPSGDLTGAYASTYSGATLQTMQNVQRFREAFIRPLAAVGNTRVWNLMIDVVAQTGRYPQTATAPANFMVDGEQRYWVHVAIDRFTGQILDKQVEVVRE